jgi:hypothetical protein
MEIKAQIILILAVKRTPLRSKRKPVTNLAQVSIKLLALKIKATNPASNPISYMWGVAIPPSPCKVRPVKKIHKMAFSDCAALVTVNYNGTEEDFGRIEIGPSNTSLTSAQIKFPSSQK